MISEPHMTRCTKTFLGKTKNSICRMAFYRCWKEMSIKPRPERFQDCKNPFDLILTCGERVYDQVVEDTTSREQETCQPVHVVNVNNLETHKEATLERSSSATCASASSSWRAWRTGLASCCRCSRKRAAGTSCTPSASTEPSLMSGPLPT